MLSLADATHKFTLQLCCLEKLLYIDTHKKCSVKPFHTEMFCFAGCQTAQGAADGNARSP
jgi:hypothetical protein